MKDNERTKRITGIAILTAIAVVLQFIANYVTVFNISINLSLIPIVIGAILYGPLAGAFLGIINGAIVLTAPSTSVFFSVSPIYTVLTCLLKTSIAGLVVGYINKLFKEKNEKLGAFLSSIIAPIINTLIFSFFCLTAFNEILTPMLNDKITNIYLALIVMIGVNFIFEFLINLLLSNTIYNIIRIKKNK